MGEGAVDHGGVEDYEVEGWFCFSMKDQAVLGFLLGY